MSTIAWNYLLTARAVCHRNEEKAGQMAWTDLWVISRSRPSPAPASLAIKPSSPWLHCDRHVFLSNSLSKLTAEYLLRTAFRIDCHLHFYTLKYVAFLYSAYQQALLFCRFSSSDSGDSPTSSYTPSDDTRHSDLDATILYISTRSIIDPTNNTSEASGSLPPWRHRRRPLPVPA